MAMFNSKCNTLPEGIPWIPQGSAAESAAAVAIRGSAAFRHVAFAAAAARRHEAWHVGHHGECWAWVDDMAMGCWNKPFKFLGYILALWFFGKLHIPWKTQAVCSCQALWRMEESARRSWKRWGRSDFSFRCQTSTLVRCGGGHLCQWWTLCECHGLPGISPASGLNTFASA